MSKSEGRVIGKKAAAAATKDQETEIVEAGNGGGRKAKAPKEPKAPRSTVKGLITSQLIEGTPRAEIAEMLRQQFPNAKASVDTDLHINYYVGKLLAPVKDGSDPELHDRLMSYRTRAPRAGKPGKNVEQLEAVEA